MNQIQKRNLYIILQTALKNYTDEEALQMIQLFPIWEADNLYIANTRLQYNNKLYRVLITHTSHPKNTPDINTDLYQEIKNNEVIING